MQSIIQDIWLSLRQARVVIAELSGRNPNVMYEIGLAHVLKKPIILLTRNQEDVPFDLKSLRYHYYDPNNPEWGLDLRNELTLMLQDALTNSSLGAHLHDIDVNAALPEIPMRAETDFEQHTPDNLERYYGAWHGKW